VEGVSQFRSVLDKTVSQEECAAGLLHWFTSPYIHRLEHDPGKSNITVTVLNLFARPVKYTIPLAEIAYPDTLRPQVSFQVWTNSELAVSQSLH
jgi:hypothetical protein